MVKFQVYNLIIIIVILETYVYFVCLYYNNILNNYITSLLFLTLYGNFLTEIKLISIFGHR